MTPDAGSDGDLRVHLNAHAEVQLQRRRGNLQRARHITLWECVQQIIGGNGVLHHAEVCRALKKVLTLSRGVLGADRLTIDALGVRLVASTEIVDDNPTWTERHWEDIGLVREVRRKERE